MFNITKENVCFGNNFNQKWKDFLNQKNIQIRHIQIDHIYYINTNILKSPKWLFEFITFTIEIIF